MCKRGNQTREQGRTRARKGREKCTSHQRIGSDRTSHDISTGHSITFTIDAGSMYKHAWPRSHETGRRTGIVLRGWSLVLTFTAVVASFSTISGHCILFCIFWHWTCSCSSGVLSESPVKSTCRHARNAVGGDTGLHTCVPKCTRIRPYISVFRCSYLLQEHMRTCWTAPRIACRELKTFHFPIF